MKFVFFIQRNAILELMRILRKSNALSVLMAITQIQLDPLAFPAQQAPLHLLIKQLAVILQLLADWE